MHVTVVEAVVGRLDRGLRGRGRRDAADGCCGNNRCGRRRSGLEPCVLTGDRGGSRPAERVRPNIKINTNVVKRLDHFYKNQKKLYDFMERSIF